MGQPRIFYLTNILTLLSRDGVLMTPTTKIRGTVNPRICSKYRTLIVKDRFGCIANSFETDHFCTLTLASSLMTPSLSSLAPLKSNVARFEL